MSFLSLLNEHRNPIQNELSEAIAEERIGTDCFFQNRAYILWNLRPGRASENGGPNTGKPFADFRFNAIVIRKSNKLEYLMWFPILHHFQELELLRIQRKRMVLRFQGEPSS